MNLETPNRSDDGNTESNATGDGAFDSPERDRSDDVLLAAFAASWGHAGALPDLTLKKAKKVKSGSTRALTLQWLTLRRLWTINGLSRCTF